MTRPVPKNFCCEQMQTEWKAGVEISVAIDGGKFVDTVPKPIAFCPWCGFRFKVKDKGSCYLPYLWLNL